MNGYVIQGWESLFVAEAGAAAALAGLLFVAVSINLTRILEYPGLSGRAAEALGLLFFVLVIATLGLVPGQSPVALAGEVMAVGGMAELILLVLQIRDARRPEQRLSWSVTRIVSSAVATLPAMVAGLSVLIGSGGGFYWLVPAILLAFAAALVDAWVLLVEILR
jgi:modulator of FtsH protease